MPAPTARSSVVPTLGMARNATFAAKTTLPWRTSVNDDRMSFVLNVAYNPAGVTPLVFRIVDEFVPPIAERRFLQYLVHGIGHRIHTCADKR